MNVDRLTVKNLQRYHHQTLNTFGEHETLVDAISLRPGFFGPSPVAFLSLYARRSSLRTSDLDEAILNDRFLIRASAFRANLYLLSSSDYPLYYRGTFPLLKSYAADRLVAVNVSDTQLQLFAVALLETDFQVPQSHDAIMDMIYLHTPIRLSVDMERLLLRKLCDLGVLVRTFSRGWKGNQFAYALFHRWLPDLQLRPDNPESARTEIIRRYLRCYGPASAEDVVWWTGLSTSQVQRSISHLRREVARIPVEACKEDMLCLREKIDDIRKPYDACSDIQMLPPWDPYTGGWQNKRRLCDKEWMPWVNDAMGNSASVIVSNGQVIGLWQYRDTQVSLFEFHVFPTYHEQRRQAFWYAEEFAVLLSKMSHAHTVNVIERQLPQPLRERPAGSFLWPLGKEPPFKTQDPAFFESPMDRRSSNTFRSSYLDSRHLTRPS